MANYTLKRSDPAAGSISVAPLTTDDGINNASASTSLYLAGRGIPNFGEGHQTNFLRLLENFASPNEPLNASVGQLWYNKGTNQINVCINVDSFGNATWRYVAADAVYSGPNPPDTPNSGDLWYDTGNHILFIFDEGYNDWIISHASACQVGPVAPSNPINGQMWYNTASQTLMIWVNSRSIWAPAINEAFQYLALLM